MNYKVIKKTPKVIEEEITNIEIEFPLIFETSQPGSSFYFKIINEKHKFHCFAIEEHFLTGNSYSDMNFSFMVLNGSEFDAFVLEYESAIKKINKEDSPGLLQRFEDLLGEFSELFKK